MLIDSVYGLISAASNYVFFFAFLLSSIESLLSYPYPSTFQKYCISLSKLYYQYFLSEGLSQFQ